MARERLIEPRITMESLLAKPRSFSNLPALLDLNRRIFQNLVQQKFILKGMPGNGNIILKFIEAGLLAK